MSRTVEECLSAQKLAFEMLTAKVYPQQHLLSESSFRSHASKRMDGVHFRLLESCERDHLLYPLLCCKAPTRKRRVVNRHEDGTIEYETSAIAKEDEPGVDTIEVPVGFWFSGELLRALGEEGDMLWPGQRELPARTEETDPVTGMSWVWRYYHPYQTLMLSRILSGMRHTINLSGGWSDEFVKIWEAHVQQQTDAAVLGFRNAQTAWFRQLSLLLGIEDLYLPWVREKTYYHAIRENPLSWHEWQKEVSRESILELTGWSVEEVTKWRSNLAMQAVIIDPNERMYMLMRSLPYSERQRLKGNALMAWDYYEVAEILGLFLQDLTGVRQPNVDDLRGGGDYKMGLYGLAAEEIDYRSRNVLPALTRHLGVDVRPRVLWLVEGQTEYDFLLTHCEAEGIVLEREMVQLHHMAGINTTRHPAFRALLNQAKQSESAVVVTIDNEKGAEDWVRLLETQGFSANRLGVGDLEGDRLIWGVFVWTTNFENDNFSLDQLLNAWLLTIQLPGDEEDEEQKPRLREKFAHWVVENHMETTLRTVQGFAHSQHLRYDKPAVVRALSSVIHAQRTDGKGTAFLPIERLLGKVRSLSLQLDRGRMKYD